MRSSRASASHVVRLAALIGIALMLVGLSMPSARATPLLSADKPTLAPMLKEVLPSVVNIKITARQSMENPLLQDPFFRRFFGLPDEQQPRERQSQPVGSGVIIDNKEGLVLTNHHVIAQAEEIVVNLSSGRDIEAELVGSDPETDIAVLRIDASGLPALPMADSDALQVGDFVLAIGNPFGLGQTVTSGIVSALGRMTGTEGYQNFIQTDAAINPGNSGGALINLDGELVGINSQILSRTGGNIGIGFAIPTNLARTVMDQLVEHGDVQRGKIGIVGQTLTDELAKAFDREVDGGVVITKVMEDSPAEEAGLKAEDIIIEADGARIDDMLKLRNHIGLKRVGDRVKLKVLRDGKERRVTVEIGDDEASEAGGDALHPKLEGARLGPIQEDHPLAGRAEGVQVLEVAQGSPAAGAGLRPGDIIMAANRQKVTSVPELSEIAGGGSQLLLHIRRGNGALFLLLQ
ncbi:DegQ family serine endoprotease [Algiphilus sp.]|uniref:DegQ family serine endoprotease n=1 Tax=Algiphilus sp. TaxID=1872431 RepID=UPI003C440D9B